MQTLNIFDKEFSQFNAFRLFDSTEKNNFKHGKQLLEQLQCTLEIDQLLNIFAMEAAKFADFSGLYFQKAGLKVAMRGSRPAKKERKFEIKINGEFIGVLNYAINSPLSLANHEILKQLHAYLAYPLRNAIMYHQAMLLAMEDALTGLGNRRYFDEQLKRAMHQANRHQSHVGLIVADLDKFKFINDTYGHQVGDQILEHFAKALQFSIRDSDSAFRFGGDEFVILVEQASDNALVLIETRIKHALNVDPVLAKYQVNCSLGATFMNRADNEHSFFARADDVLYQRKTQKTSELRLIK
ncbi:MAG: GGDEF domain-containing protein [Thalassotalea sp.]